MLRLALELGFFTFATWALYDLGFGQVTATFGTAVVLPLPSSYDRIWWLVKQ
jgi:hypothetical protein